jgi:hypothetical protein
VPEQRKPGVLLEPPPSAPFTDFSGTPIDRFLEGLLGNQAPGDLPAALGAAFPLFPILRALKGLKLKTPPVTSPTNVGDKMLREHLVGSPRLREFLPVGEEGAAMAKDPWQTILDLHGKPKASPPGSGGGVKHDVPAEGPRWPVGADLEALKAKLRKPKDGK